MIAWAQHGINRERVTYGELVQSQTFPNYKFIQLNLEDRGGMEALFISEQFDVVCNLAAQAGVRYSLKNPHTYVDSNIVGFVNILENCRHHRIKHLVYASSSSVYGLNETIPFSTSDNVDHPISLYAASKKSNELMAHTYSHLFNLPTTGLRFFTVYGTWGRPDMAYMLFTDAILNNRPIKVFNNGNMKRDFTYVKDIVEGVTRVIDQPASGDEQWSGQNPDPRSSKAPFKVYNIGNENPIHLMDFIQTIEKALGKEAEKIMMPIQPGDVETTFADVKNLKEEFNYKPNTSIEEGIQAFVDWYNMYYLKLRRNII